MNYPSNNKPVVSIIFTQRERFSYTQESLESVYQNTHIPFQLIYVDAGSPAHIEKYLASEAQAKGFQVVRLEHYLSPNQARNVGLSQVTTKYVVFIDNDVIVTPNWLSRLVQCAEETNAAVVGPTICISEPIHEMIHNPGGSIQIKEEWVDGEKVRRFHHKCHFKRKIEDVQDRLVRAECDYVEFHCMLARTEIFEKTGPLDEKLLSTREHLDFCMLAAQAGGRIYAERDVIVTYVPGPPLHWSDLEFFMLRWSNAWDLASLEHFIAKWNLVEDGYFKKRYERLGFRRHKAYVKPLAKTLSFGANATIVEKVLVRLDHVLNGLVSHRYTRQNPPVASSTSISSSQLLSASSDR